MNFVNIIFEKFPAVEIAIRRVYWSSPLVNRYIGKMKKKSKPVRSRSMNLPAVSLDDLKAEIIRHGIKQGDILIVHSSMQELKCTGKEANEIIDMLLDVIGPTGTLVMPAIPKYREAPSGTERITHELSNEIWIYDRQRTPAWTGALPTRLMKTPGAIRSRHPLNTIVALGRQATEMLAQELSVPNSLPSGPESPWAYCAKHNAKVLGLGVDLAHSITMIHVAEDCHEGEWPIKKWYRERKFRIVDNGKEEVVQVRERHPRWAMHYAERKLSKDLKVYGISQSSRVGSIEVWSLESAKLIAFLEKRRSTGYPYYFWKMLF